MKTNHLLLVGIAGLALLAATAVARPERGAAQRPEGQATGLVATVRTATERFRNPEAATAAGYALFHGCVSGPQEGAIGVHYVNGALVGDGELDPAQPEALIYEVRGGQRQLVGVEYDVLAEAWHARHEAPPVLAGQLLHYVGAPNRYGIPAFYELNVWAWKANPNGAFADWNPTVSCDDFTPPVTSQQGHP